MNPGIEAAFDRQPPKRSVEAERRQNGSANALPLRLLLRFSDAGIERRFVEQYVAFYFRYAQASLVLGLLLVIGDYLVDHFAHSGGQANLLRLTIGVPVLAPALVYSALPTARRHWQPVMAGFIVALAVCLFWILLRIDAEGGAGLKTWVGVLNFTFLEFYCFVILGVQFRYALACGLLILCAFEAAMWAHAGLSAAEVAYWSYHVVTLFMLAAGIGWWREFLLRKEFSARTALDEARAAAEELARVKGAFLATMSHEIRTPLNGVLGMNELLIDSDLAPEQRAWAEGVQASGRHLLGVISDILDFSKVDSGAMQLESVDFSVVDLVEEAVLMFAQPAQAKGLELAARFDPPAEQLSLSGDPFRLRQVIANLISNAIKFTGEGEVIVSASVSDDTGHDVALHLCVEDTGIGVAPEAQARIFEQFAQADGSTTRTHGGTGLGLAICTRLLELMGGRIRLESARGEGSKFHIELRLPKSVAALPAAAPGASLAGLRVLVVDANRSVREILRRQLQGWAMSVDCAADGPEALLFIEAAARAGRPFQLALLDRDLPGIDGLQLARDIRERPSIPPLAVILLTSAYAGCAPRTRAAPEAPDSVEKPVRRVRLLSAITRALDPSAPGGSSAPLPLARPRDALRGHVLLVEDNAINQRVAIAMLTRFGLSVSVAADGAKAVEMVREETFDLVLMDCQMPLMDGPEATRRIRAWEATRKPRGAALPIVALTANAIAEDRAACAAAGMTGYLAKPITGASLFEVLAGHLEAPNPAAAQGVVAAAQKPATPGPTPRAMPEPARSIFDPQVLAELPMVADGTDPDFALSVLEQFVRLSTQAMARCRDAVVAPGGEATLRDVHTLKSSSAQVGAQALAACAAELEEQLRAGTLPTAADWSLLEDEHQRAVETIQAHLDRAQGSAPRSVAEHSPA
jgi:signal transduction histidine kinase/CheY-like chemotaxis protein/HPt (histidine-containing phosphotransfer) domain-containing protein